MLGSMWALGLVGAAVLFQIWVTWRVRRTPIFDGSQKSAQTKLIWFVPVIGAAVVFAVLQSEEQYERREDPKDQSR
jgi:uncharacterized membrane protein YeaQ/YmgE (transglycosylase-associated protein family)